MQAAPLMTEDGSDTASKVVRFSMFLWKNYKFSTFFKNKGLSINYIDKNLAILVFMTLKN